MKEITVQNSGLKYSEMLLKIYEKFDNDIPFEISFEDAIQICCDAWNLANRSASLKENKLYKKELKSYTDQSVQY